MMKLSYHIVATSVALLTGGAQASSVLRADSKTAQDLLQNARRVQQGNNNYQQYYANNGGQMGGYYYGQGGGGGGGDKNENWWLADYSIKMISCMAGEQSVNYERGDVESSTVVFRLCPVNSCSSNSTMGCDTGYGDYAVGINTFAEAFAESVRDNYQYYEINQMQEYFRECKMLEGGGGGGGGQGASNYYYGGAYTYIGPACSADGKNIRLATFSDPYCMYESDSSQNMYDGMQLPYSNGGVIPETCMNCLSQNYDNYEYEVSDMCKRTYEDASYRCEENMESYNWYYGKITQGCDYLESKVGSMSDTDVTAQSFFEETSHTVENDETLQWVLLFVGAACVSSVAVLCLVRNKRSSCNKKGLTMEDDDSEDAELEMIDADDVKEILQNSQRSAIGLMKSATKSLKNSIHKSARHVADMTRSKGSKVNEDEADKAYQTMDKDEEDKDYVLT